MNFSRVLCVGLVLVTGWAVLNRSVFAEETAISAADGRKNIGKTVVVEFEVKATKDRLEKKGMIYIDSEADFRDEKNLAVVITKKGAEELKAEGIENPAEHFKGKMIRVKGTIREVDKTPRITVESADAIELVMAKQ